MIFFAIARPYVKYYAILVILTLLLSESEL